MGAVEKHFMCKQVWQVHMYQQLVFSMTYQKLHTCSIDVIAIAEKAENNEAIEESVLIEGKRMLIITCRRSYEEKEKVNSFWCWIYCIEAITFRL